METPSKAALITGRVLTILASLFFLMDSIMKLIRESHSVEGTTKLGWNDSSVVGIGVALFIPTILYIIPKTAIFGALLITAYLGGAVATMARLGVPYYFPVVIGIIMWAGLYLRDSRLQQLLPFNKLGKF